MWIGSACCLFLEWCRVLTQCHKYYKHSCFEIIVINIYTIIRYLLPAIQQLLTDSNKVEQILFT